MNIPQLPTDNLYKFKAITFTFLTVVFLVLMFLSFDKYQNKTNNSKFNKTLNEYRTFNERIDTLNTQLKEIDSLILIRSNDSLNIHLGVETLNKWKLELIQQKYHWKINKIYADDETDLVLDSNDFMFDLSYWGSSALFILSLIMMLLSFNEWKNKLQIYQDIILQKEAGVYEVKEDNPSEIVKEDEKS